MQFHHPVAALFNRAEESGVTMQEICGEAGVAQSTTSRWKDNPDSATLATIRKLDEALTAIIARRKQAA